MSTSEALPQTVEHVARQCPGTDGGHVSWHALPADGRRCARVRTRAARCPGPDAAAVVIRSSTAQEVQQLVGELRSADPVTREAAVARLRVLGSRALARLATLIRHDPQPTARLSGLRALEGIDDPRVVDAGIRAIGDADADVRVAAIAALRPWVLREDGTRVMDALVTSALDPAQDFRVRAAALDALSELPPDLVRPIVDRAALDPRESPALDSPAAAQEWLANHRDAPLSSLHALLVSLREREAQETDPARRGAWLAVRGAAHAVLAHRESRVALYDLRETFEGAAAPLPLDFLHAVAAIGDASCLEPLARAWSAAPPGETWWRSRVSETGSALLARLRLTPRHAAVARVRTRWPGFLAAAAGLSTTSRTRRARSPGRRT